MSTATPSSGGFTSRHIGPREGDIKSMLQSLGESSLDSLIGKVVPDSILLDSALNLGKGLTEEAALAELHEIAEENIVMKSMIGQGYYGCYMPAVIQRNVLESPGWYTSYTPYQPEIAQGRLEVLFNFQTLVAELTGMAVANASLLDEGTAAAEAMTLCHRTLRAKRQTIIVSDLCHPQSIDVIATRAEPLDINVRIETLGELTSIDEDVFAVMIQYPATDGSVEDHTQLVDQIHRAGALAIIAADLLALTLVTPPSKIGADVVIGSAQRFGVPMGFGGPHAAFMATSDKYKRNMPGRLIGQSIDAHGNPAYRLALQTREQHIRREKATSNICTAQALLAILATLFACYHGPAGLTRIARRIHRLTCQLGDALSEIGVVVSNKSVFDTLRVKCDPDAVIKSAEQIGINLRRYDDESVGISVDQTTTLDDIKQVLGLFTKSATIPDTQNDSQLTLSTTLLRSDRFLTQECFHRYHSETEMMRYLRLLADRDIALDRAMIPLGSCTMKLNSAAEMMPVSWPEFANIHPFVPESQSRGYRKMIAQLEQMLCECTGYAGISLQPNAGSQGEYAGLLAIKRYHESRGDTDRHICLIPSSAHGTNPASAQMAGLDVVVVACDKSGNIDMDDLVAKLAEHGPKTAAIMITYPSTHGVFEAAVREVCVKVHEAGAQVYIDGANLNAMVGLAEPGRFGGDVSHLNLHKTFCIPHGGGGPGVGPIGVAEHLIPFLPGHRHSGDATGVVSAAPWGSAQILPITWMYIRMMGGAGLFEATRTAILNANYIAKKLSVKYPVLYTGDNGYVAHECIIDTRSLKDDFGITVDDLAKRLIDYGFHAPTMSFPVPGTLMIEPTESESKEEIDRFINAMLSIREEITKIESGEWTVESNPLSLAPHTAASLLVDDWTRPYSRQQAAFPTGDSDIKYWPPVGRVDNVHGDKHLICSCPPLTSYMSAGLDT